MLYQNEYGSVNFWDPYPQLNGYKNIGVSVSGGTDSASLLFITCREIVARKLNINLIVQTLYHTDYPNNLWNVNEIVLCMKELFPTVSIEQTSYDFDNVKRTKLEAYVENVLNMYENKVYDISFGADSSNPPRSEMEKHNFGGMDQRILHRDLEEEYVGGEWCDDHIVTEYRPYIYIHKKFIAELYKEYDLMDNLFPLTTSCVNGPYETDHFTKPCRVCWWCHEKKWAFGMYDGCET